MFCPILWNKLKKMQDSGGNIVKTMLYEGSPTKIDLTALGMGTAYLLSTDNVISASYAQAIHYERRTSQE